MKRSKALELIEIQLRKMSQGIEAGQCVRLFHFSEKILSSLQEAGMLPPQIIIKSTHFETGEVSYFEGYNEWEPEES